MKGMAAAAEFDGGELWTDEKHVSFLNWMEACFVRRLAEDVGRGRCRLGRRRPRLDRFVPDISESTHDLRIRGVKNGGRADSNSYEMYGIDWFLSSNFV